MDFEDKIRFHVAQDFHVLSRLSFSQDLSFQASGPRASSGIMFSSDESFKTAMDFLSSQVLSEFAGTGIRPSL